MSLQQQLEAADLQKLKKQLDVREESLADRERLLDDSERIIQLDVLDKQIEAKTRRLNEVETRLSSLASLYAEEQAIYLRKLDDYDKECIARQSKIDRLEAAGSRLIEANKKLRDERDHLQTELKESKRYFKDQEQLVDRTIADWNIQLKEFEAEGEAVRKRKNDELQELVSLDQEKIILAAEVNDVQGNLSALQTTYDNKAREYKAKLSELSNKIVSLENTAEATRKEQINREKELVIRENAVIVKESALRAQEDDINARERRLQMNYRLKEIPAE